MNIFSTQLGRIETAFKAIGFEFKKLSSGEDPQALEAFIESQKASAVEAATADSAEQLTQAAQEVEAATKAKDAASKLSLASAAKISALEAALEEAGIKISGEAYAQLSHESTEEDVSAVAAGIGQAVTKKISTHAAEQLAANGHTVPAVEVPAADPAKPAAQQTLTGLARTAAALK